MALDITNAAQLMVFIRYAHGNNMLLCQPLEGQTTGNDIFIRQWLFCRQQHFTQGCGSGSFSAEARKFHRFHIEGKMKKRKEIGSAFFLLKNE